MSAKGQPGDPILAFAELLRGKGGLEVRAGVLDGARVEFFRGKDFARWVRAHPDRVAQLLPSGKAPTDEDAPRMLCALLLRRGLIARCERMVKRPPPGSKKLVKFPKKLLPAERAEAHVFAEDAFYHYTYGRPTSVWTYVWAALAVVGVLAGCLFPLAPVPIKLAVFYTSAGLLVAILALLALRSVVAAVTWIASGSTLWLLPNLLNEEVPIPQLFRPLVSLQPRSTDSKWGSHPLTRAGVGAALAMLFWLLYAHSPDSQTVARTVLHSRDELLDWLNINPDVKRLANASTAANDTAAPVNATDDFIAAEAERAAAAGGGEDGDDGVAAEAEQATTAQEVGGGEGAGREEL